MPPFIAPIRRLLQPHDYASYNEYDYGSANTPKLALRVAEVVRRTWDLGFTAFGGPPVHFQILWRRFVVTEENGEGSGSAERGLAAGGKVGWVDEQTYQEIFALVQALPGPASTKMLFCLALIHAGLIPAIVAFLFWSLPGAMGMFALALGVQQLDDVLPSIVYALLSGLNAATVGIVALAAVQLAEKAIKDKVSRMLVIFGACAGLCYSALWFFPVLILIGGLVTAIWDVKLQQVVAKVKRRWQERRQARQTETTDHSGDEAVEQGEVIALPASVAREEEADRSGLQRRTAAAAAADPVSSSQAAGPRIHEEIRPSGAGTATRRTSRPPTEVHSHVISIRTGLIIIVGFFASFIIFLVARALIENSPFALQVFTNMYLAGTIIFGGGPVVIPLLREYVVGPGWVSSRDFLLGLAIIQAFPGPNFNFAVYLCALAFRGTGTPTVVGALLGFVGIFTPGLLLAVGVQGLWRLLRTKPVVAAMLRGINATAVGLVFTAVYRLWQIGYLTPLDSQGQSLAMEPWWVVVAVVTYAESCWWKVPPAPAILFGAVLGLGWYGVTGVAWPEP